ncbi:unnamed protein product [Rhizoctonia solani]|uniref:Uncharacterized protein n=1 Tax=Rhizoctonia solani TaxID=456999 RepID=A0A8H3BRR2_9AGAM|nr:unnamed protein product [Rhizoctonia solani]
MSLRLKNEAGSPYVIRIKRRGFEVYDPERAALMMQDPPPQPEGRKIEDIPLFMRKQLPANFPDNSHLPVFGEKEVFKGTPNEVALEFKNKGNAFFRARKWWDAREAYIDAWECCPSDPKLEEVLWLNMAAANLELNYWPGVLCPAAEAITLNLKSTKAYYRAARALIHYERYEEALDCCKRVLAFDPHNEAILELMDDPNLGGNVSNQTKAYVARQALEKENGFIILRTQSLELDPNNFPYIRPAIPKMGHDSKLYFTVNFKYPERNALDVFVGVGPGACIEKLLLPALPGSDHAPTTWHSDVYFDPLDITSEHARLVRLQAEKSRLDYAGGKHPLWDPAYQHLPHNLSIYLETYKRQVVKVECSRTIGQALRMVAEQANGDKSLELDPNNFPYIRPAIPKMGHDSKLYFTVNFKYPERNALDVFVGVGPGACIKKLLLPALPGSDHAPTTWHSDVYFDPLDITSEHARLVRLQAEKSRLDYAGGKHPLWDPAYQHLPHNLSIYLETYKRQVVKVECSRTIGQALRMVAEQANDDKVCLEGGSIVFNVFRPGCKAEKLWLEGKGRKGFALAHPTYKKTDAWDMLNSGYLRTWVHLPSCDNLEEISIAARSEIIKNAQVVSDRA